MFGCGKCTFAIGTQYLSSRKVWENAVEALVPPKFKEVNKTAFSEGFDVAKKH